MGRPKGSKHKSYTYRKIDNTCLHCGCVFQTYPSQPRKFCSLDCRRKAQGQKVSRTCLSCGNQFDVYESDVAREPCSGKYCSRECKSTGKLVTRSCAYCGLEFETPLSRVNSGRGKYCSKECYSMGVHSEFLATCPKQICATCGKEFVVSPYLQGRQKHCSRKCGKTGSSNPQWIGGHTIEYPPTWTRKLRRAIKERDGYKCALCGEHATDVHHIDYNKDNCVPENLISLCHSCHGRTNTRRGEWMELFKQLGTGQVDHQHVTEIIDWIKKGVRA